MKHATENCHNSEVIGEQLRLPPNFTFPPQHLPELNVLEKRNSSVANDKFGVDGKDKQNEKRCSPTKSQSNPYTQVSVP